MCTEPLLLAQMLSDHLLESTVISAMEHVISRPPGQPNAEEEGQAAAAAQEQERQHHR